jgi:hypothetical protein
MAVIGAIIELLVVIQVDIGRVWGFHVLIVGALLAVVGIQVMALGICAHTYGTYYMSDRDPWFDRMRARFDLEHGLAAGALVTLVGLIGGVVILVDWINHGFGALAYEYLAVLAMTLIIIGIQIFFTSFLISILGLRRRDQAPPLTDR